MTLRFVLPLCALLAVAACAAPIHAPGAVGPTAATDMTFASYAAADRLVRNAGGVEPDRPLLVASLVDINDLRRSSSFGRVAAEQIASRLVNAGYTVIELKLRDAFLIEEGRGEFILSRDVRDISRSRGAQAVVAGTYAVGARAVYVSVRLIRATDSRILAAHDYTLPLTEDTLALIGDGFVPTIALSR